MFQIRRQGSWALECVKCEGIDLSIPIIVFCPCLNLSGLHFVVSNCGLRGREETAGSQSSITVNITFIFHPSASTVPTLLHYPNQADGQYLMNNKCLILHFLPKFNEKGMVQLPGSPPLLNERGGCLCTPSPSDTFCPQQGSQKGNTENQRHLVATGALSSGLHTHRVVRPGERNGMISSQPGP